MKQNLHIVKIGGQLINDQSSLIAFLRAFQKIKGYKLLIHGGGRKATEISSRLGIETTLIEGRRVTSPETLEVATMVYAGLINKKIVSLLQGNHINAIGLSGADADVVRAHQRPIRDINYGLVGDIETVNTQVIHQFLINDLVPILCAISHDGKGQLLNTNADTIAAQVAIAMSQLYHVHLSFCFEYLGVLYDMNQPTQTIHQISKDDFIEMKSNGKIHTGMVPKLSNGFEVLQGGVDDVVICGISNLVSKENATILSR